MNEQKKPSTFEDSLNTLTCDDLAPKKPKAKKQRLSNLFWMMLACCLFAIGIWALYQTACNVIDFIKAENEYGDIADNFSPISGKSERPLRLETGSNIYPIADYEAMYEGNVSYPSDDPLPSDPGNDSPSGSDTDKYQPDDTDPLISEENYLYFKDRLEELQTEYNNSDVFAWIYIPGTNINYPVVVGKDNDYYLDRNPYKKWNTAGSIFMDYRNRRNLLNNQFTIIYGHNIRTRGTMFNRLLEFKKQSMFEKYQYIYIYTKDAALKYLIFSVYEGVASEGTPSGVMYQTGTQYLAAINSIKDKSIHQREDLELTDTDRVLELYTCANTSSNDDRCFVFGVLVEIRQ